MNLIPNADCALDQLEEFGFLFHLPVDHVVDFAVRPQRAVPVSVNVYSAARVFLNAAPPGGLLERREWLLRALLVTHNNLLCEFY